jgi:hypothetical protein
MNMPLNSCHLLSALLTEVAPHFNPVLLALPPAGVHERPDQSFILTGWGVIRT